MRKRVVDRGVMDQLLHRFRYIYEVYIRGGRIPKCSSEKVRSTGNGMPSKLSPNETAEVFSIDNAICCGEAGFVFDKLGLLHECSLPIVAHSKIRRPVVKLAKEVSAKKVFHLAGECSWNRAHFMLEHGIRLMIGMRKGVLANCDALLVHNQQPSWLGEYLRFFKGAGLPFVRTSKQSIRLEKLEFVPGASGDLLRFTSLEYQEYGEYLREGVREKLGDIEMESKVVWISRKDAPERACINISDLQRSLAEFSGKEITEIVLSEISLEMQIRQLSEASVIVSEEGQALNLLPFVSSKTVLILDKGKREEQSRWNRGFEEIGRAVGNQVYCLFSGLDNSQLQWEYPLEKFEKDLNQLTDLAK